MRTALSYFDTDTQISTADGSPVVGDGWIASVAAEANGSVSNDVLPRVVDEQERCGGSPSDFALDDAAGAQQVGATNSHLPLAMLRCSGADLHQFSDCELRAMLADCDRWFADLAQFKDEIHAPSAKTIFSALIEVEACELERARRALVRELDAQAAERRRSSGDRQR